MVPMIIVGGLLAVVLVIALVVAEVVDRRRAIGVDADASRFAAPALNPKLPWL